MIEINNCLFDTAFNWAAVPDSNHPGWYVICLRNREKVRIEASFEDLKNALIRAGFYIIN